MSLMDGRLNPINQLDAASYSHVRVWGVLDIDRGVAKLRATCRRCGDNGEFDTRQEVNAFKAHHEGANNKCPHEREVKY